MSDSYTDRYHDHLDGQGISLPDQVLTNPVGTQYSPLPDQQSLTTPTPGFQPAINGMSQADWQRLQAGKDLAMNTALGFALPGGVAADTLGPMAAAARAEPAAAAVVPKTIIPSPVTQGQFVMPATRDTPDLLGNLLQQRATSATYQPPAGTNLSGAPSAASMQAPPLGQPMSLPKGFQTTLPNGQSVTTTGMHWLDNDKVMQVEVHHGNPAQTEWQPLTKLLGGGAAAGAGVVASNQAQAAPHPGAKVITDAVVPGYIQDIINSTNQNQKMYQSDWANGLNVLNPLRGVNIPSSFYGDQGTVGPAEQDPAYANRLTGVVQGNLVRMPNGVYGYPLGTATTTAPVTQ